VPAACDEAATVPTARSGTPTVLHWCRQRVMMLQRRLQHAVALGRCFTESVQAAEVLRACKGAAQTQYNSIRMVVSYNDLHYMQYTRYMRCRQYA
jgi:hypothetical protein